jgi:4-amino-4-deoxy-L-arabinose transferase-like glycosyltransferase
MRLHRKTQAAGGQTIPALELPSFEVCLDHVQQSPKPRAKNQKPNADSRYIPNVHTLVRQHRRFFLGVTLAGLALRLFFFFHFPAITNDSRIYADLATNWLQHGIYGETQQDQIVPTDARLPGYPAFLAVIFALFGPGNFNAVLLTQIVLDLITCLLIADLARRTVSGPAARIAFALACLCPFLANYSAAALTETLEIFFTVMALDLAAVGLEALEADSPFRAAWKTWAGSGAAVAACILLRPDGGILLASIGVYMLVLLWKRIRRNKSLAPVLIAGIVLSLCALAPLVPWTMRNFRTLHLFQPLAPRYATEQDELAPRGFNRWVKTWIADYTSVEEFYWSVPGANLDSSKLPARAFDSPQQRETTLAIIADYNQSQQITPDLDARFDDLAAKRIRAHPVRYYAVLPVLRIADMWLRPRTEILPPDPRWWEFNDEISSSVLAVALGILNLVYIAAACLVLMRGRSQMRYLGMFLIFVVLRSAFLGTLENPESRYTLECYPAVVLLAAMLLSDRWSTLSQTYKTP